MSLLYKFSVGISIVGNILFIVAFTLLILIQSNLIQINSMIVPELIILGGIFMLGGLVIESISSTTGDVK